ncbi:hypothetical protein SAMN04487911_10318 [Arenibacter nanhaiticus]|uniref:Uncharacterized protein n=1 Tax=Arenibacter nanhaiticus TaxID=558155 RepID=A0A1M6BYG2_9FLAO|nr:hypothetical protein SAMN04487911_10318 [Arenibacter nanhaiticus]
MSNLCFVHFLNKKATYKRSSKRFSSDVFTFTQKYNKGLGQHFFLYFYPTHSSQLQGFEPC